MPGKPVASVTPISAAPSRKAGGEQRVEKRIVGAVAGVEAVLPRDQWDRPLILLPDGSARVAYRRASAVAESLEDHFGLHQWEKRLTAEGLALRPDLMQEVSIAMGRVDRVKLIGEITTQAIEVAGGSIASRNGNYMHRLTELLDRGEDLPPNLPANVVAMLEVYEKTTERFEILDTEKFTVQDTIRVGGTYDRRLLDTKTGKVYIGDLKTGQKLKYLALKTCAQVAVYASGLHYDLDDEREPHDADKDTGALIWLPWTDKPEEAICEVRRLDLRYGRRVIREAQRADELRKVNASQAMPSWR